MPPMEISLANLKPFCYERRGLILSCLPTPKIRDQHHAGFDKSGTQIPSYSERSASAQFVRLKDILGAAIVWRPCYPHTTSAEERLHLARWFRKRHKHNYLPSRSALEPHNGNCSGISACFYVESEVLLETVLGGRTRNSGF